VEVGAALAPVPGRTLAVGIDDHRALAGESEMGRQVGGDGGFAATAFGTGDQDGGHTGSPSWASGYWPHRAILAHSHAATVPGALPISGAYSVGGRQR